jgi:GNAT superfamily N-acetyltransferase
MDGALDIAFSGADTRVGDRLQELPRSAAERFAADRDATWAPHSYFAQRSWLRLMWQNLVDEHERLTGERLQHPYVARVVGEDTAGNRSLFGNTSDAEAQRMRFIRDRLSAAKTSGIEYQYDPDLFDPWLRRESERRNELAARYVGTGNGLAAVGGRIAAGAVLPHNIPALLVPPTRFAAFAVEAPLLSFLRSVGRESVLQGGVNVATQAVGEVADYAARKRLGTEQSASEVGQNLAFAAAGGVLLGGSVRVLHEGWRRLPWAVRQSAPADVRDAAPFVELSVFDARANPLPREATPVHERAIDQAQLDVLHGRPARVGAFVADATEAAIDGPSLLARVAPRGEPGVRIETGRAPDAGVAPPASAEPRPATPAERLPGGDRDVFVVHRDETGTPIGVLRLTTLEAGGKRLDPDAGLTVFVRPEHRRQGIASDLYRAAATDKYNVRDVAGRADLTPTGAAVHRAFAREKPGFGTAPPDVTIKELRQAPRDGPHFVPAKGRGNYVAARPGEPGTPGDPDLGFVSRGAGDDEKPIRAWRSDLPRLNGRVRDGQAVNLGYTDPWHLIRDVAANWDAVYAGANGRLVLVKRGGSTGVAVIEVEAAPKSRHWAIVDGGERARSQIAALGDPVQVRTSDAGGYAGDMQLPHAQQRSRQGNADQTSLQGQDADAVALGGTQGPPDRSENSIVQQPSAVARTERMSRDSAAKKVAIEEVEREIVVSRKVFGEAAQHMAEAIRADYPEVLTINRPGAKANRKAALRGVKKVRGKDLDEYPPAMFSEGGAGASVKAMNHSDNRALGAYIQRACRGLPNGAKITLVIKD